VQRRCEVKVVRRSVPIGVLLLVLMLLMSTAVGAGPPPRGEEKPVAFAGDISGEDELIVESKKKGVTVYGPSEGSITLELEGSKWGSFEGSEDGKLRITLEGGVATVYFDFDWYFNGDVKANVPLHHLEGFGAYGVDGQTYEITLNDTVIYLVEPHRTGKGKGSGFGLEFTEVATISGDVLFDVTIDSQED
jgi:hypothetical protein